MQITKQQWDELIAQAWVFHGSDAAREDDNG